MLLLEALSTTAPLCLLQALFVMNAGAIRNLAEVQGSVEARTSTGAAASHRPWPLKGSKAMKRPHRSLHYPHPQMRSLQLLHAVTNHRVSQGAEQAGGSRLRGNSIDCETAGGWLLTAGPQPIFRRLLPGEFPADCRT
jgi:hypothetical protein